MMAHDDCTLHDAWQVVPRQQVGEAQGVVTSLKALTEGLGPLVTAAALPWFEGTALPGAPWLMSAGFIGLSLLLCLRLEKAMQTSTAKLAATISDSPMQPATEGNGILEGGSLRGSGETEEEDEDETDTSEASGHERRELMNGKGVGSCGGHLSSGEE